MNIKGNSLALGVFFVFITLMLSVAPAQAIVFRENVTGHAYIHSATTTYELTVPQAEVSNYADLFDYQKGAHYTMTVGEGSSLHLSVIVTNNRPNQITVEGYSAIRVKPTPDESWTTIWSDTATNTINSGQSSTAASTPTDATAFGWWADGCQLHFCLGLKIYPTSDPSDWTYSAFSIWFMVGTSATTTTPPPTDGAPSDGDGTTTTPGTPPDYSYEGTLAFLDPFANALGISRMGVAIIIGIVLLCMFGGIVHMLTKDEEY